MEERKDEIPKRERWLRQLFQGAKAPNPYFYAALKEIRRQGQFNFFARLTLDQTKTNFRSRLRYY